MKRFFLTPTMVAAGCAIVFLAPPARRAEARYGPDAEGADTGWVATPPEIYDPATGLWTMGDPDLDSLAPSGGNTLRAGDQTVVARRYELGSRQGQAVRQAARERGVSESTVIEAAVRGLLASPSVSRGGRLAAGAGKEWADAYDPATGMWVGDGDLPRAGADRLAARAPGARGRARRVRGEKAAEAELWAVAGEAPDPQPAEDHRPGEEPGSGLRHVVAMLASGSGAAERELKRGRLDSRYGPHEDIDRDPMTGVSISGDGQVAAAGADALRAPASALSASASASRGADRVASAGRGEGKTFLVRPEIARAVKRRARQLQVSEGEVVSLAVDRLWAGAPDAIDGSPQVGQAAPAGRSVAAGRAARRSRASASSSIVDSATGVVISVDDPTPAGSERRLRTETAEAGNVPASRTPVARRPSERR